MLDAVLLQSSNDHRCANMSRLGNDRAMDESQWSTTHVSVSYYLLTTWQTALLFARSFYGGGPRSGVGWGGSVNPFVNEMSPKIVQYRYDQTSECVTWFVISTCHAQHTTTEQNSHKQQATSVTWVNVTSKSVDAIRNSVCIPPLLPFSRLLWVLWILLKPKTQLRQYLRFAVTTKNRPNLCH